MDAKEAARIALDYFKNFASADLQYSRIAIEEVEYDDNEGVWLITIGYVAAPQFEIVGREVTRSFKVITIRDSDGRALAMRFREFRD